MNHNKAKKGKGITSKILKANALLLISLIILQTFSVLVYSQDETQTATADSIEPYEEIENAPECDNTDVNGDYAIDFKDVNIVNMSRTCDTKTNTTCASYDINNDTKVNILDLDLVNNCYVYEMEQHKKYIAKCNEIDVNDDLKLTMDDLLLIAENIGCDTTNQSCAIYDIDGYGAVGLYDFQTAAKCLADITAENYVEMDYLEQIAAVKNYLTEVSRGNLTGANEVVDYYYYKGVDIIDFINNVNYNYDSNLYLLEDLEAMKPEDRSKIVSKYIFRFNTTRNLSKEGLSNELKGVIDFLSEAKFDAVDLPLNNSDVSMEDMAVMANKLGSYDPFYANLEEKKKQEIIDYLNKNGFKKQIELKQKTGEKVDVLNRYRVEKEDLVVEYLRELYSDYLEPTNESKTNIKDIEKRVLMKGINLTASLENRLESFEFQINRSEIVQNITAALNLSNTTKTTSEPNYQNWMALKDAFEFINIVESGDSGEMRRRIYNSLPDYDISLHINNINYRFVQKHFPGYFGVEPGPPTYPSSGRSYSPGFINAYVIAPVKGFFGIETKDTKSKNGNKVTGFAYDPNNPLTQIVQEDLSGQIKDLSGGIESLSNVANQLSFSDPDQPAINLNGNKITDFYYQQLLSIASATSTSYTPMFRERTYKPDMSYQEFQTAITELSLQYPHNHGPIDPSFNITLFEAVNQKYLQAVYSSDIEEIRNIENTYPFGKHLARINKERIMRLAQVLIVEEGMSQRQDSLQSEIEMKQIELEMLQSQMQEMNIKMNINNEVYQMFITQLDSCPLPNQDLNSILDDPSIEIDAKITAVDNLLGFYTCQRDTITSFDFEGACRSLVQQQETTSRLISYLGGEGSGGSEAPSYSECKDMKFDLSSFNDQLQTISETMIELDKLKTQLTASKSYQASGRMDLTQEELNCFKINGNIVVNVNGEQIMTDTQGNILGPEQTNHIAQQVMDNKEYSTAEKLEWADGFFSDPGTRASAKAKIIINDVQKIHAFDNPLAFDEGKAEFDLFLDGVSSNLDAETRRLLTGKENPTISEVQIVLIKIQTENCFATNHLDVKCGSYVRDAYADPAVAEAVIRDISFNSIIRFFELTAEGGAQKFLTRNLVKDISYQSILAQGVPSEMKEMLITFKERFNTDADKQYISQRTVQLADIIIKNSKDPVVGYENAITLFKNPDGTIDVVGMGIVTGENLYKTRRSGEDMLDIGLKVLSGQKVEDKIKFMQTVATTDLFDENGKLSERALVQLKTRTGIIRSKIYSGMSSDEIAKMYGDGTIKDNGFALTPGSYEQMMSSISYMLIINEQLDAVKSLMENDYFVTAEGETKGGMAGVVENIVLSAYVNGDKEVLDLLVASDHKSTVTNKLGEYAGSMLYRDPEAAAAMAADLKARGLDSDGTKKVNALKSSGLWDAVVRDINVLRADKEAGKKVNNMVYAQLQINMNTALEKITTDPDELKRIRKDKNYFIAYRNSELRQESLKVCLGSGSLVTQRNCFQKYESRGVQVSDAINLINQKIKEREKYEEKKEHLFGRIEEGEAGKFGTALGILKSKGQNALASELEDQLAKLDEAKKTQNVNLAKEALNSIDHLLEKSSVSLYAEADVFKTKSEVKKREKSGLVSYLLGGQSQEEIYTEANTYGLMAGALASQGTWFNQLRKELHETTYRIDFSENPELKSTVDSLVSKSQDFGIEQYEKIIYSNSETLFNVIYENSADQLSQEKIGINSKALENMGINMVVDKCVSDPVWCKSKAESMNDRFLANIDTRTDAALNGYGPKKFYAPPTSYASTAVGLGPVMGGMGGTTYADTGTSQSAEQKTEGPDFDKISQSVGGAGMLANVYGSVFYEVSGGLADKNYDEIKNKLSAATSNPEYALLSKNLNELETQEADAIKAAGDNANEVSRIEREYEQKKKNALEKSGISPNDPNLGSLISAYSTNIKDRNVFLESKSYVLNTFKEMELERSMQYYAEISESDINKPRIRYQTTVGEKATRYGWIVGGLSLVLSYTQEGVNQFPGLGDYVTTQSEAVSKQLMERQATYAKIDDANRAILQAVEAGYSREEIRLSLKNMRKDNMQKFYEIAGAAGLSDKQRTDMLGLYHNTLITENGIPLDMQMELIQSGAGKSVFASDAPAEEKKKYEQEIVSFTSNIKLKQAGEDFRQSISFSGMGLDFGGYARKGWNVFFAPGFSGMLELSGYYSTSKYWHWAWRPWNDVLREGSPFAFLAQEQVAHRTPLEKAYYFDRVLQDNNKISRANNFMATKGSSIEEMYSSSPQELANKHSISLSEAIQLKNDLVDSPTLAGEVLSKVDLTEGEKIKLEARTYDTLASEAYMRGDDRAAVVYSGNAKLIDPSNEDYRERAGFYKDEEQRSKIVDERWEFGSFVGDMVAFSLMGAGAASIAAKITTKIATASKYAGLARLASKTKYASMPQMSMNQIMAQTLTGLPKNLIKAYSGGEVLEETFENTVNEAFASLGINMPLGEMFTMGRDTVKGAHAKAAFNNIDLNAMQRSTTNFRTIVDTQVFTDGRSIVDVEISGLDGKLERTTDSKGRIQYAFTELDAEGQVVETRIVNDLHELFAVGGETKSFKFDGKDMSLAIKESFINTNKETEHDLLEFHAKNNEEVKKHQQYMSSLIDINSDLEITRTKIESVQFTDPAQFEQLSAEIAAYEAEYMQKLNEKRNIMANHIIELQALPSNDKSRRDIDNVRAQQSAVESEVLSYVGLKLSDFTGRMTAGEDVNTKVSSFFGTIVGNNFVMSTEMQTIQDDFETAQSVQEKVSALQNGIQQLNKQALLTQKAYIDSSIISTQNSIAEFKKNKIAYAAAKFGIGDRGVELRTYINQLNKNLFDLQDQKNMIDWRIRIFDAKKTDTNLQSVLGQLVDNEVELGIVSDAVSTLDDEISYLEDNLDLLQMSERLYLSNIKQGKIILDGRKAELEQIHSDLEADLEAIVPLDAETPSAAADANVDNAEVEKAVNALNTPENLNKIADKIDEGDTAISAEINAIIKQVMDPALINYAESSAIMEKLVSGIRKASAKIALDQEAEFSVGKQGLSYASGVDKSADAKTYVGDDGTLYEMYSAADENTNLLLSPEIYDANNPNSRIMQTAQKARDAGFEISSKVLARSENGQMVAVDVIDPDITKVIEVDTTASKDTFNELARFMKAYQMKALQLEAAQGVPSASIADPEIGTSTIDALQQELNDLETGLQDYINENSAIITLGSGLTADTLLEAEQIVASDAAAPLPTFDKKVLTMMWESGGELSAISLHPHFLTDTASEEDIVNDIAQITNGMFNYEAYGRDSATGIIINADNSLNILFAGKHLDTVNMEARGMLLAMDAEISYWQGVSDGTRARPDGLTSADVAQKLQEMKDQKLVLETIFNPLLTAGTNPQYGLLLYTKAAAVLNFYENALKGDPEFESLRADQYAMQQYILTEMEAWNPALVGVSEGYSATIRRIKQINNEFKNDPNIEKYRLEVEKIYATNPEDVINNLNAEIVLKLGLGKEKFVESWNKQASKTPMTQQKLDGDGLKQLLVYYKGGLGVINKGLLMYNENGVIVSKNIQSAEIDKTKIIQLHQSQNSLGVEAEVLENIPAGQSLRSMQKAKVIVKLRQTDFYAGLDIAQRKLIEEAIKYGDSLDSPELKDSMSPMKIRVLSNLQSKIFKNGKYDFADIAGTNILANALKIIEVDAIKAEFKKKVPSAVENQQTSADIVAFTNSPLFNRLNNNQRELVIAAIFVKNNPGLNIENGGYDVGQIQSISSTMYPQGALVSLAEQSTIDSIAAWVSSKGRTEFNLILVEIENAAFEGDGQKLKDLVGQAYQMEGFDLNNLNLRLGLVKNARQALIAELTAKYPSEGSGATTASKENRAILENAIKRKDNLNDLKALFNKYSTDSDRKVIFSEMKKGTTATELRILLVDQGISSDTIKTKLLAGYDAKTIIHLINTISGMKFESEVAKKTFIASSLNAPPAALKDIVRISASDLSYLKSSSKDDFQFYKSRKIIDDFKSGLISQQARDAKLSALFSDFENNAPISEIHTNMIKSNSEIAASITDFAPISLSEIDTKEPKKPLESIIQDFNMVKGSIMLDSATGSTQTIDSVTTTSEIASRNPANPANIETIKRGLLINENSNIDNGKRDLSVLSNLAEISRINMAGHSNVFVVKDGETAFSQTKAFEETLQKFRDFVRSSSANMGKWQGRNSNPAGLDSLMAEFAASQQVSYIAIDKITASHGIPVESVILKRLNNLRNKLAGAKIYGYRGTNLLQIKLAEMDGKLQNSDTPWGENNNAWLSISELAFKGGESGVGTYAKSSQSDMDYVIQGLTAYKDQLRAQKYTGAELELRLKNQAIEDIADMTISSVPDMPRMREAIRAYLDEGAKEGLDALGVLNRDNKPVVMLVYGDESTSDGMGVIGGNQIYIPKGHGQKFEILWAGDMVSDRQVTQEAADAFEENYPITSPSQPIRTENVAEVAA